MRTSPLNPPPILRGAHLRNLRWKWQGMKRTPSLPSKISRVTVFMIMPGFASDTYSPESGSHAGEFDCRIARNGIATESASTCSIPLPESSSKSAPNGPTSIGLRTATAAEGAALPLGGGVTLVSAFFTVVAMMF